MRTPREDLERGVLVREPLMLVVVDDALVARESRVHVQAAALAQPQPHRLAQPQLHQRARGGRVDRLVTERPLVLALVLACSRPPWTRP